MKSMVHGHVGARYSEVTWVLGFLARSSSSSSDFAELGALRFGKCKSILRPSHTRNSRRAAHGRPRTDPTRLEKSRLSASTVLSIKQVDGWFKRRRQVQNAEDVEDSWYDIAVA